MPLSHRVLFGPALVQGAASVLAWTFGPSAYGDPSWHVHDMVFGHALGVSGGFLLARLSPRALLAVAGAWAMARAVYFWPEAPSPLRAVL